MINETIRAQLVAAGVLRPVPADQVASRSPHVGTVLSMLDVDFRKVARQIDKVAATAVVNTTNDARVRDALIRRHSIPC